jgi:hypothetical protein
MALTASDRGKSKMLRVVLLACLVVTFGRAESVHAADTCPASGASKFCCSVALPDDGAKQAEQYQFRGKDQLCYGLVQMPHAASGLIVAGIVQEPALTDHDLGGKVQISLLHSITDRSVTFHVEGASLADGSFRLAGDLTGSQTKVWNSGQFKQLQQSMKNFDFIAYLPADPTRGRARPMFTPVVLQAAGSASPQGHDFRITLRSDFAIGDLALSFIDAGLAASASPGVVETPVSFERKGARRIVANIPTSGLPAVISLAVRKCETGATACVAKDQVPSFIDVVLSK